MKEPKDNSGATNKAASDAASGVKSDASGWSTPLRETYETNFANATKKS
jgi:hypothetical protein